MHVALLLEANKAQFVHDKIEDLVGQADEVDRKFLQVRSHLQDSVVCKSAN